MMSEVISSALGRKQPAVFLLGPSFAKEVGRLWQSRVDGWLVLWCLC
jgi:glycerol-3-phosphate dehydrogenase